MPTIRAIALFLLAAYPLIADLHSAHARPASPDAFVRTIASADDDRVVGWADVEVPMNLQYPLLLKILAFDRSLARHADDELVIGVLHQGRVRDSWIVKDDFIRHAKAAVPNKIGGRSVRCVAIEYDGDMDLGRELDAKQVDILYVAPLRATALSAITSVTRRHGIVSITGVPEYVREGVAVGVGLAGDNPVILVNLKAAKAEGVDFHAHLLRLATVVEE